jgi:hypothetical protein
MANNLCESQTAAMQAPLDRIPRLRRMRQNRLLAA